MTIIIILLVLAILLSAFFSGSEVALVSITELKAQHLADQKLKGARALLSLKEQPNRMLITILIGNNLVNIGGSALATMLAINLFASAGVGIATGVMTFLILTFGEIAPKTFATKNAKSVALAIAPIIHFLMRLLAPFVWFFDVISRALEKLTNQPEDEEPTITEQELKHIVKVGEQEGQIKATEKEMIQRIFLFDDTEVKDVMTPRTDMFSLDWNLTIQEALPIITSQEYSRIPVHDDNVDKIKGIVFTRELLEKISKDKHHLKLKDIAQPALFIPEHKKIDKLLKEMQRKKTHMAIIVSEHGGVEGVVTIEDILEEIVGEIFDESDDVEKLIKPHGSNDWLILGKTPLDVLNEELKTDFSLEEDYNTIAGLIQHKLGKIPEVGERCRVKDEQIDFFIKKMEGPVILEVGAKRY